MDCFARTSISVCASVTLEIPPLRERREDIPVLVEHLLKRINARVNRRVLKVPHEVMSVLQSMTWIGNVRELENTLTRAVVMAPGEVLLPELFQVATKEPSPVPHRTGETVRSGTSPQPVLSLDDVERGHIVHVLESPTDIEAGRVSCWGSAGQHWSGSSGSTRCRCRLVDLVRER